MPASHTCVDECAESRRRAHEQLRAARRSYSLFRKIPIARVALRRARAKAESNLHLPDAAQTGSQRSVIESWKDFPPNNVAGNLHGKVRAEQQKDGVPEFPRCDSHKMRRIQASWMWKGLAGV